MLFSLLDSDSLTLLDLLESADLNFVILDQAKVLERMTKEIDMLSEAEHDFDDDFPLPESALVEKELTPEEEEAKKIYEAAAGN